LIETSPTGRPQPEGSAANSELDPSDAEDLYRIGTVAKLTGIAVERLRAWERRYDLEPARRAGKIRYYDGGQLKRLQLIKQLLDQGHPISSLIHLHSEQLKQRLGHLRKVTTEPARVGLAGPNLLTLETREDAERRIDVHARWPNIEALLSDSEIEPLDVLVVQMPVLLRDRVADLERHAGSSRVVVVYQFSTDKHLEAVRAQGTECLHWPAAWQDIERVCATTAGKPLRAPRSAPRRFSDEELVLIAASSTDSSALPAHIVELVTELNALAEFAATVARDADGGPVSDNAALYERVHTDTTQARAALELALEALAVNEGLVAAAN
jgi:DNA-binding transcriptional MerR regulator